MKRKEETNDLELCYNEDLEKWEIYKPFARISIKTEKDFDKLQEILKLGFAEYVKKYKDTTPLNLPIEMEE